MESLTKTENKVVHQIALGDTVKEIATKMYVSTHTVVTHKKNIFKKLGARNIADVTRAYILSLDNPKLVLRAALFLALQTGMIVDSVLDDFRRVKRTKVQKQIARSGRCNKFKDAYYV